MNPQLPEGNSRWFGLKVFVPPATTTTTTNRVSEVL
jgi:hypothetical protein